VTRSSTIHV